jgi:Tfp pilus assembly protein PilV
MLAKVPTSIARAGAIGALRSWLGCGRAAAQRLRSPRRLDLGADSGFMLIEVLVSAMLVSVIVVGLLNGFDAASNATTDQRLHADASLLAAQSQEELRSDPINTLSPLEHTPHVYTQTVGNQTFTVTERTKFIEGASEGENEECTATTSGKSNTASGYLKIISEVTWHEPQATSARKLVTRSIITGKRPGDALEVDVNNGGSPSQPVEGATVIASGLTTITGAQGCAVYNFQTEKEPESTTVAVAKTGWVIPSGATEYKSGSITLVPNLVTHYPIQLGQAGAILGEFTNQKKAVTGDTFVAYNTGMNLAPNFELGGTNSTYATNTYASTAQTATNLFPFSTGWATYAGTCPADNPEGASGGSVHIEGVPVIGGATTKATVLVSYIKLEVYTGSSSTKKESLTAAKDEVKITEPECASSIPDNGTTANNVHQQYLNGKGVLTNPYQPYGKYKLCVYAEKTTYTTEATNTSEAGTSATVYLKASSGTSGGVTTVTGQSTNTC